MEADEEEVEREDKEKLGEVERETRGPPKEEGTGCCSVQGSPSLNLNSQKYNFETLKFAMIACNYYTV